QIIHVVTAAAAMRPALTKAGQRAINDARVDRLHRVVADAQTINDAGTELFKDDISGFSELQKDVAGGALLEIEGDGFLVAIDLQKSGALFADGRRTPARRVANTRLFDLDDFRAQIAEHHRGERAGQHS